MQRPSGDVCSSAQLVDTAGTKLRSTDWLWPFKVAVTVAFWLLLTLPEVAVKVALICPEATVTLGGTVSNPLLLVSDTIAGPVTAWFKVTVQVLDELLPSVEGAQASDISGAETLAVAERVKVWERPLSVAVSTAV